MQRYFQGKDLADCVKHIEEVANEEACVEEKKRTLKDLAAELLYTIRNNQFHSIKGANNIVDKDVLQSAYCLLEPIVESLFPVSYKKLEIVTAA